MIFQQDLQTLPGIVIACLSVLVGIVCAAYGYHIWEKRSGSPEPVIQHGSNVVFHVDKMVKLWLKVILVAPGITIRAGKLTAIVGIYAIAAPEPAIYESIFIQDGLKFLWNVFNHFTWPIIRLALFEGRFVR